LFWVAFKCSKKEKFTTQLLNHTIAILKLKIMRNIISEQY